MKKIQVEKTYYIDIKLLPLILYKPAKIMK